MSRSGRVPPYISTVKIVEACEGDASYRTIITDLRNAGLLPERRRRARIRISSSALLARLPDYYDRVSEFFARNPHAS